MQMVKEVHFDLKRMGSLPWKHHHFQKSQPGKGDFQKDFFMDGLAKYDVNKVR